MVNRVRFAQNFMLVVELSPLIEHFVGVAHCQMDQSPNHILLPNVSSVNACLELFEDQLNFGVYVLV